MRPYRMNKLQELHLLKLGSDAFFNPFRTGKTPNRGFFKAPMFPMPFVTFRKNTTKCRDVVYRNF